MQMKQLQASLFVCWLAAKKFVTSRFELGHAVAGHQSCYADVVDR